MWAIRCREEFCGLISGDLVLVVVPPRGLEEKITLTFQRYVILDEEEQ